MKFDPRNSKLVAWLNFVAAIIAIVGVVSNFTDTSILGPLQNSVAVPLWVFLASSIFVPSLIVWASRLLPNASQPRLTALHKYAGHPEVLHIIDENGKEFVGGHAGNFHWNEVANAICKGMELEHLRYSNLGTKYELHDVINGKVIEIPTDTRLEENITKTGVKNGQILLVLEKP